MRGSWKALIVPGLVLSTAVALLLSEATAVSTYNAPPVPTGPSATAATMPADDGVTLTKWQETGNVRGSPGGSQGSPKVSTIKAP